MDLKLQLDLQASPERHWNGKSWQDWININHTIQWSNKKCTTTTTSQSALSEITFACHTQYCWPVASFATVSYDNYSGFACHIELRLRGSQSRANVMPIKLDLSHFFKKNITIIVIWLQLTIRRSKNRLFLVFRNEQTTRTSPAHFAMIYIGPVGRNCCCCCWTFPFVCGSSG